MDLYPPLVTYYNRLAALLTGDEDITPELDYDNSTITINVSDTLKATAWREILPEEIDFGELTAYIEVNNTAPDGITEDIVEVALKDNNHFSRLEHVVIPKTALDRWFCYMEPDIIQLRNDNFASPEGIETWTAEDLTKEVLNLGSVSICTECIIND